MNVLVIDDHPLVLAAMRSLVLGLGDEVSVVAAASAEAARAALADATDFDLALLDLRLGDGDGFDVLSELRESRPAMPVVVVAASEHRDDVMRAIDLGAMGFVPKFTGTDTLLEALKIVLSGGIYLPPSIMRSTAPTQAHDDGGAASSWDDRLDTDRLSAAMAELKLTPRQKEVLTLLLRGQSNKLIARALNLSVETVKDHVAAVLRVLHVTSRTQAVVAVSRLSNPRSALRWRQRVQPATRQG